MYTYKLGISAREHDDFVKRHPQNNLLQSSSWAKVKDNWGNERLGVYQDQTLVAVASILIQPLPLGWTMMYIPRGPIMDYSNEELIAFVMQTLKKIAKKHRAVFVKFDPSIYFQQHLVEQEATDLPQAQETIQGLEQAGCKWKGRTSSLEETIQPRFQANIYAEYFTTEALPKRVRQLIQVAEKKGAVIEIGGTELISDFAALMAKTEVRKNIHLRNQEYYEKLLSIYGEDAYITMASLNVKARYDKQVQELAKHEAMRSTFTKDTRQTKVAATLKEIDRLQDELTFLKGYLDQGLERVPLAATLSLNFGDSSENIYAGMDDDFKQYQPALATWYKTAQHAFELGVKQQNMGGIENQLDGGLYHFKSKFNPMIEEFIGEFDLPVSPFYKMFSWAYQLRKTARNRRS
ncbi:UDP-N-acetylmuramoylpentapeptide-lysine N(6)-alanyltransferase [Streptococcus azizii]|uniref:UDP-N-acetylmuramoylpentapeptide-lysine N(6)-alanyltransferase n=1 Tax=Streptococcus azizii TaxID=1579424 RepID=A0AB36JTN9_9STRE|nr:MULTISPECIES: aminoacyltransferase [Streptococcus]MBF0775764.1 aminoacyltransferase [Streptococcus sp. 19428wD3_AN2]ONK29172.1 UDP-N-acetylmuramoylpentapeptide-lysine N(6)-alanyltransferase [Streptococcus azizii]ONK29718.1 UDP-N-acetylmuramoylpentapeptide-lysine N(6)-alanyltransferase [Streptococcus azizii]ONK30655.1 UDP-N-acetylmuramoylpentapeptide-lysine N(6)-alanyltransferase [Streptococcus azizii]TFU84055.1 aminoacyltransferase [Streptococcus sp. AN2]